MSECKGCNMLAAAATNGTGQPHHNHAGADAILANFYVEDQLNGEKIAKVKIGYSAQYLESHLRTISTGWPKEWVGCYLSVMETRRIISKRQPICSHGSGDSCRVVQITGCNG